jgi:kumamolisin
VYGQRQIPRAIAGLQPAGRVARGNVIGVTVALPLRDQAAAERLVADQADPASPDFMRYLTPAEFGNRFGRTQGEYDQLQRWLKSQGLRVLETYPSRLLVRVQGTAAQVEGAFAVRLNRYHVGGRDVFANDTTPSLSAEAGIPLLGAFGLDNVHTRKPSDAGYAPYTPFAINTAYNYSGLRNLGYDGTGQTIAIYALAAYRPANLSTWASSVYLYARPSTTFTFDPSHVSTVPIDNGDGTTGSKDFDMETDLDVELCLGSLPGANVQVWLAENGSAGMDNIFAAFANQTAVKVMTCSWGDYETDFLPSDTAELDMLHALFVQTAAEGLTIFSASGDAGAYDGAPNASGVDTLAVDHPACDPYVVGVGGTTLATNSDNTYASETGWGYPDPSDTRNIEGSGGGLSVYFGRPAWQTPSVAQNTANMRQVPDVALNADPNSGYYIRTGSGAYGSWLAVAGTSAAAPEWASATVLMEQSLGRSFFLSPLLYRVAASSLTASGYGAPFHDVKSGNNGLYSCAAGFDLVTGLGSVDFTALRNSIAAIVYDVNGDGTFNLLDVAATLRRAGGLAAATQAGGLTVGDLNADGRVTVADAVRELRMLNNL